MIFFCFFFIVTISYELSLADKKRLVSERHQQNKWERIELNESKTELAHEIAELALAIRHNVIAGILHRLKLRSADCSRH